MTVSGRSGSGIRAPRGSANQNATNRCRARFPRSSHCQGVRVRGLAGLACPLWLPTVLWVSMKASSFAALCVTAAEFVVFLGVTL